MCAVWGGATTGARQDEAISLVAVPVAAAFLNTLRAQFMYLFAGRADGKFEPCTWGILRFRGWWATTAAVVIVVVINVFVVVIVGVVIIVAAYARKALKID